MTHVYYISYNRGTLGMLSSASIVSLQACPLQPQKGPFGPGAFGYNRGPLGLWHLVTIGAIRPVAIGQNRGPLCL